MSSSYHYLYRITNLTENRHYYGARTCRGRTPQEDIGIYYFSSSKCKSFIQEQKKNPDHFKYKIVLVTKTRKHLIQLECKIHRKFDVAQNNAFYNRANQTSSSFDTTGFTTAKDHTGNFITVPKDDPRFQSGELVGVVKGLVSVKDKSGNTMQVSVNDPTFTSGELVHVNKGMIVVKDKSGNTMQVTVDDPRLQSGELVYANKGMIAVKDVLGNRLQVTKNDPRYLSGELVGVNKGISINKGMIVVKNKDGNITRVSVDDPRYLSGEFIFVNKGQFIDSFYITNGSENKRLKKGTIIPDGFVLGRTVSRKI